MLTYNVIFVSSGGFGKVNTISIVKDFDMWTITSDRIDTSDSLDTRTSDRIGTGVVTGLAPNKRKRINNIYCASAQNAPGANAHQPAAYKEHFEYIWNLYPNKKGKGKISDTKKKELHKIPVEHWQRIIDRYKEYVLGSARQRV